MNYLMASDNRRSHFCVLHSDTNFNICTRSSWALRFCWRFDGRENGYLCRLKGTPWTEHAGTLRNVQGDLAVVALEIGVWLICGADDYYGAMDHVHVSLLP